MRIYSFYLLTRENDIEFVVEKLDELISAMKYSEPRNAELFYNMARLFARYCGRKQEILDKTLAMLEESISLEPENSAFHTEIGAQKCMLGEFTEAYQIFQKATTFDDQDLNPLYGMIYCKI